MRVAFFGSSRFSCIVLDALRASRHEVVAVVTQPDQPAGRKLDLTPTEVCCQAGLAGLTVLKPAKLRGNAEFRRSLAQLQPAALLVASYGQIIPPKVLALTPWPLNVHPSLLPQLRGASPIRSALLQGCSETGCCVMLMTERMDDGDLACCERLAIAPEWNYAALEGQLARLGGTLAVGILDAVEQGRAAFTPQDHAQATYCTVVSRKDTVINWQRNAEALSAFIRAWDPDLGALTTLPNGRKLKIWSVAQALPPETPGATAAPGSILAVTKKHFWVATGTGSLRIDEVQPENKPRMSTASFLAGARLAVGECLGGREL